MAETEDVAATLQRMLEKEIGDRRRKRGLFGRFMRQPVGSSEAAKDGRRSSDLTIAALGVTLGLICALFPWYIFFNQEKFGVRAMRFSGSGTQISGPTMANPPQRVGAPMQLEDVPTLELDLFSTATLPDRGEAGDLDLPGLDEQPFPAADPVFRVVHVANGRAMIEDDSGLWVVQPGSKLPDNTTVARIEERDGAWVVVTSGDRVLQIQ